MFEHIDVDINKVLLVPFQSTHHWSLLVLIFDGMHLYSVDSGRTKLFAHNDLQYAPAIAILEKVLKLRCKTITRSPTRLALLSTSINLEYFYTEIRFSTPALSALLGSAGQIYLS